MGTAGAYDALAPHFRAYSASKAAYLDAVDRLVASRIPAGARSLLDVGSGDGERAVRFAAAAGIETVVLVEPSEPLAARCREQPVADVWRARAEALPDTGRRFDVVTCLWNVLGHVTTREARLDALARMRASLSERGRLFVDVNNRYNARAYGWLRTLGRAAYDTVRPSESNGDVTFTWRVAGVAIPAAGHVFTPREVESLFRRAGLSVRGRDVVDYATGARRRWAFEGQLLYELGSED